MLDRPPTDEETCTDSGLVKPSPANHAIWRYARALPGTGDVATAQWHRPMCPTATDVRRCDLAHAFAVSVEHE